MSSMIETCDRKRRKFRGGHCFGFMVFFLAFVARSALKIADRASGTPWTVMNVILALALAWLLYFSIRLVAVERRIRRDPALKEALYDERDRLNELKAWKIAFYSLIFLNLIAAYLFHIMAVPLREPMILIVTSLLVGFGSFDLARWLLDR